MDPGGGETLTIVHVCASNVVIQFELCFGCRCFPLWNGPSMSRVKLSVSIWTGQWTLYRIRQHAVPPVAYCCFLPPNLDSQAELARMLE